MLYLINFLKRYWRQSLLSLLLMLPLFSLTSAETNAPEKDLRIALALEVGDAEEDFNDAADTAPRGQFVTYRIAVENQGNTPHEKPVFLMDVPDYMLYQPNSTYKLDSLSAPGTLLQDIPGENPVSPLENGYGMEYLEVRQTLYFTIQYQIDPELTTDPEFALAWASVDTPRIIIPVVSNTIETKITGEPKAQLQVTVTPNPAANTQVYPRSNIFYNYLVHNRGGKKAEGVTLTTYIPEHTACVEKCGSVSLGDLEPNGMTQIMMIVQTNDDLTGVTEIKNTGYDLKANEIALIQKRETIIHYVTLPPAGTEGEFFIRIKQNPNILLNSRDGSAERADQLDRTDTEYQISYKGRQPFVYPSVSSSGYHTLGNWRCGYYGYNFPFGAYFYAYNSYRTNDYCNKGVDDCWPAIVSGDINFKLTTDLPQNAPEIINATGQGSQHQIVTTYTMNGSKVNAYMIRDGQIHSVYVNGINFSRAIQNGTSGVVNGNIETVNLFEDRWVFTRYKPADTCCDKWGYCSIPGYRWQKESSQLILQATATTDISVLTSTAWLKTQGGHIGTNKTITMNGTWSDDNYNYVDLSYTQLSGPFVPKKGISYSNTYTPSNLVFPASFGDGYNSDYFIFAGNGNPADFDSKKGDNWIITGTTFGSKTAPTFLQKGDPYDQEAIPRDYYKDMFTREKYGEILPAPDFIPDGWNVGDNVIWKTDKNITIGSVGGTVKLRGGQARIYTTGTVYINANIEYDRTPATSYAGVTSVRIDAEHIFVSPSVTDIEVMMLARGTFHSGKNNQQLRILGDVIAGEAFWEREPLLEVQPKEFNKPSEYIIEDMRKYVVPPPGDTQRPGERTVWRQVNPSTGEAMDAY